MNKEIYNTIKEISPLWNKLYVNNPNLTWFQSYNWNESLEKKFWGRKHTRYSKCRLIYIVFDKKIIVPLVENRKKKLISLLGNDESSDYLSFIFGSTVTEQELYIACIEIFSGYRNYKFILDKIYNNSLCVALNRFLEDKRLSCQVYKKECVHVVTQTESESFYKSLSKSSRQNYRTAINRIKKTGYSYEIKTDVRQVSISESEVLYEMYAERRAICDNLNLKGQLISKAREFIKGILRENDIDVLSDYCVKEPVFLSEILIDGKLAAYCEGNINNDKQAILISRVAIKKEFYNFSPGHILLIDTIENVKDKFRYFDLTRGTETYKFKLGGKIHYNYCYELNPK